MQDDVASAVEAAVLAEQEREPYMIGLRPAQQPPQLVIRPAYDSLDDARAALALLAQDAPPGLVPAIFDRRTGAEVR